MEDYIFKKSTCETYTIRWGGFGWAIFAIDEATGLFNCQSDYGDYNYMWPNHGRKSFKHFILELAKDTSYLLKKVTKPDTFNYDDAVKKWKNVLIQMRREGETKEKVRSAWDAITGMEDYSMSVQLIQKELYESQAINDICEEPWYLFETDLDYSPQAESFAHEIMPMFADILRKEIEGGTKI